MKLIITCLIILTYLNSTGQKLPTLQTTSFRAPNNLKVDGKPNEWGNRLQAYNPAAEIYYTISNDDENLYFIFQADDKYVINKIVNGGVMLGIQKNLTKNDIGITSIRYPILDKGKRVSFLKSPQIDETNKHLEEHILDSAMKANNRKLTSNIKWIQTNQLPGIDSLLSIYNDKGIQVANAIDIKKIYTCEMAINLKLLDLSIETLQKFTYHVVINGGPIKFSGGYTMKLTEGELSNGTPMDNSQLDNLSEAMNKELSNKMATTDFWGEYSLAKGR